jgi:hypothetical protein
MNYKRQSQVVEKYDFEVTGDAGDIKFALLLLLL